MKKLISIIGILAFPLTVSAQLSVMAVSNDATCFGACDGAASASATGGQSPYTYLWMPGNITSSSPSSLCAGTYTCTVTDAFSATATTTVSITEPTALTLNPMPGPVTICVGGSISYSANISGGVPPYAYSWNFSGGTPSTSSLANPLVTYYGVGNFTTTCWIMDANGCSLQQQFNINVSGGPAVSITEIPSTCNQSNGELYASGATAYMWQPGNLSGTQVLNVTSGVTYTLTATDPMGCTSTTTFVTTDSCDYVWPGDANDDAVADNLDILAIGIVNGSPGSSRPSASTTWIGQWSQPWLQFQPNGADYKFADCDGNGTINPLDTNAVVLNYGMTHSNRVIAPSTTAAAPTLSISFNQDSLTAGQPGSATLSLGDTVDQATNIYGLAFRLNYDAQQLSTPTFGMSGGATWLGTPGSDMIRVVLHPNAAMGYVDVAITRLDHQDVSGYGVLGQIYFNVTTNLVGSGTTSDVAATITNVTLVNSAGTGQLINVANDNIVIGDTGIITSIVPAQVAEVVVYPNPANDVLLVQIPAGQQQLVTIEDISGRIVYSQIHAAGTNTISVSEFTAGMYILRVADSSGNSSTEKISIAH